MVLELVVAVGTIEPLLAAGGADGHLHVQNVFAHHNYYQNLNSIMQHMPTIHVLSLLPPNAIPNYRGPSQQRFNSMNKQNGLSLWAELLNRMT